jgi:integrase
MGRIMTVSPPYLRKSPSGVWYIHWTEDRVGKRKSTRTHDLSAAKRALAAHILSEENVGARTLADVWNHYRREHVEPKVAGKYNADLAWKQLASTFGRMSPHALSQEVINRYLERRATGRLGHKVKPTTVGRELSFLLAAINFCADERRGYLPKSIRRKFDLPPPGAPRERWLQPDEIDALFRAAKRLRRGHRLSRVERFLWLALETAARQQAILDLTWDRVDLETGVIVFDVPGRRLTKKRRAVVPVSNALRPVLERAYEERLDKESDGLVLDNKGAIWPQIQYVAMEAGLAPKRKVRTSQKPKATGISPHVLRHTAASIMARRGVPLWIIAKILGNTLAVVERYYAKFRVDDLRDAINKISDADD